MEYNITVNKITKVSKHGFRGFSNLLKLLENSKTFFCHQELLNLPGLKWLRPI